jgi:PAS domain S-box-containing protein
VLYEFGGEEEGAARQRSTVAFRAAGHSWTIEFWTMPAFEAGSARELIGIILATGILASVLLAGLVRREVTARRDAERFGLAVAAARGQMATTLGNLSDGVVTLDESGRVSFMNPAAEALIGTALTAARGKSIRDVMRLVQGPDDTPIEDPLAFASKAAAERLELEPPRLVSSDGERRHVELSATTVRDSQGRDVGTVMMCRDIGARLATESRLRTQAAVLESMAEGVSLSDERGFILYTNPAEDRMFGYEPGELVGRHVTVLNDLPAEENERTVGDVIRTLQALGKWSGEWRNRRKDGTVFWTRADITALDLGGRKCWVCVHEDITASRASLAELHRSRTMLQTVLDNIPQGVFWKDRERRYMGANPVATRAKGVPLHRLVGLRDEDLPHLTAEQVKSFVDTDRLVLESGSPIHGLEERMTFADGTLAWLLTNKVPLRDAEGAVVGVLATWEDISSRKKAEERLHEEVAINQTISAVGARLTAELDLGALVQRLIEDITRLSGAAFGAFFYNDVGQGAQPLSLYALAGVDRATFERMAMPRRDSAVFAATFRDEQLVRSDDITKDERYGRNAPHDGIPEGHPPVRSYLAVPVVSRSGELLGALLFAHPEPRRFTERHEEILRGVAAQAAIAIDNARLYTSLRSNESLLKIVTDSVPVLISFIDADRRYRFVNRAYEDWFEVSAPTLIGREMVEVIGEQAFAKARPFIERALGGETLRFQARLEYHTGAREVDATYVPHSDDEGRITGLVAVVADVTEQRRDEARRALLSSIGAELAASLEHEETLARMAQRLVPHVADWVAVDVLREDGSLERLAVAHREPEKVALAEELHRRYPPRPDLPTGAYAVIRSGQAEMVTEITDEMLVEACLDEEHLRIARALGLKSYVATPLTARGRPLGVLTFVSAESGRIYDESDMAFAVELGRRAGLALDNGRLFRSRTESQERYRALIQATAHAVWTWRPGEPFAITEAVTWWQNLVGQSEEELREGRWSESVHPDDRARVVAAWERAFQEHSLYETEFRVRTSNGEIRHVHARGVPVLEPGGTVREWVGTLSDITDRKRAEEAALESEGRFRLMADAAPVLVWHAGPSGAYDWFNRPWLEFVGMGLDEQRGEGWLASVHPDDVERVRATGRDGFHGRRAFERKYRLARRDGAYRWLLDHGVPLFTPGGDFAGFVGSAIDITEIEYAREALERQSQELERLVDQRTAALDVSRERLRHAERMASLGTLAAGIGHDLGNLLFPVRVRLEEISAKDPSEIADDVAAIQKPLHYLGQLAQGLRLLARDPLEGSPHDERTDIAEWWSAIEGLMRNPLPTNVTLDSRLPPGLPPVQIGRTALTQAVFNLVQNAGDALRSRGRGRVMVWAEHDPAREIVRIGVTDDGPGMTPEVRARCFEPFFTTKARGISTGMGLSLVSGMVQRSGGTISVESEVGVGTTFTITVRVARLVEDAGTGARPRATMALADERYAAYLSSALTQAGFDVRAAAADAADLDADLLVAAATIAPPDRVIAFLRADPRRRAIVIGDDLAIEEADAGVVERLRTLPAVLRPGTIRSVLADVARGFGVR